MSAALELCGVGKSFTMHLQGGLRLAVVADLEFAVHSGECVVLAGPSGIGKLSILKMIFGGYRCDRGTIIVRHGTTAVNVAAASPLQILSLRRSCDRLRLAVSSCASARPRARCRCRFIGRLRRRAGNRTPPGYRYAEVSENSGHAVGPAAGNLLRRRATARQHCARFAAGPAHSSARRADGIARCCQSRAGDRPDRRKEAAWNRHCRYRA